VADGAGSAKRSHQGAQEAADTAVAYLAEHLGKSSPEQDQAWHDLLKATLKESRTALEQLADPDPLRDLATTLLLVVATTQNLIALQLGDGGIVCRSLSGELKVLSKPNQSEYINETDFLTSDDYLDAAHITIIPATCAESIAVFTDGVQFLALHSALNQAHEPFFTPLFTYAATPDADSRELADLLGSERVNALTDDDKTLVLAVRTRGKRR
jgi:hypothetical protein